MPALVTAGIFNRLLEEESAMPELPYHQRLRLRNFTVFRDAEIAFVPGINALIGENGSGKTHLLKAMYAYQRPASREVEDATVALRQLFQTDKIGDIVRSAAKRGDVMEVSGIYGGMSGPILFKRQVASQPLQRRAKHLWHGLYLFRQWT